MNTFILGNSRFVITLHHTADCRPRVNVTSGFDYSCRRVLGKAKLKKREFIKE